MSARSKAHTQEVTLDACAAVMDAFLLKGIAAGNGISGAPASQFSAIYALGCAIIYAVSEFTRAKDEAMPQIDPTPKAGSDENSPPKKATGALTPSGRDPVLLQMDKEALLAKPAPQKSREYLAQLLAEQAITGTVHKPKPKSKAS